MGDGSPMTFTKPKSKPKVKVTEEARGDSMSISSKEYTFSEIMGMSLSKSNSTASSSLKDPSITGVKPAKSARSITPPPTLFPKAGPSTATRVVTSRPATANKSQRDAKIAQIKKVLKQCLETTHKATKTGDRVSVRMMEYLTTLMEPRTESLDALAHCFLDICRLLMDIESGMELFVAEGKLLSPALVEDLEKTMKAATGELNNIDVLFGKSLIYDKKSAVGKKMKMPWGKGGASDKDFDKLNVNITKIIKELREGIEGLPWEEEAMESGAIMKRKMIPNGRGIGYTGLAAALQRLDQPATPSTQERPSTSLGGDLESVSSNRTRFSCDLRLNSSHGRPELPTAPLPPLPTRPHRSSSIGKDGSVIDSRFSTTTSGSSSAGYHRSFMSNGDESYFQPDLTEPDDFLHDLPANEITSPSVVRIKVDPNAIQKNIPRHADGFDSMYHHATLISAIRQKNRKLVEKLLDRGVSPSASEEAHPLNEAVHVCEDEIVRQLLLFGADPNEPDINDVIPLHAAITAGHLPCAVNLLRFRADPHLAAGMDHQSPLARAVIENLTGFAHVLLIYGGNVRHMTNAGESMLIATINKDAPKKAVQLLLDYGADNNGKSRDGRTPLYEAIACDRSDIVTLLLQRGASPNLPGPNHMLWSAVDKPRCLDLLLAAGADPKRAPGILEFATSINNVEAVRMLLRTGADPNASSGMDTPLCTAIRDNRQEIFQLLINNNADPNLQADTFPTVKCIMHHRAHLLPALKAAGADLFNPRGLLEVAIAYRNMDALWWLLDNELDPNEKTIKGNTPLTTAIRDNRLDVVEILLNRGADPNVRGQDFPICLAVRHPPILKKLLKVITAPRAYKGILEMAAVANQVDSMKLLIKAGISPEDKTAGIFSPLSTAVRDRRTELVYYLVNEVKADVNNPGEHLPLVMAVRSYMNNNDIEILELLLQKGADPNLVHRGWNAAMAAVERGDLGLLKTLCEVGKHGVDWAVEDDRGRTLVDLAREKGWNEAIPILMKSQRRV